MNLSQDLYIPLSENERDMLIRVRDTFCAKIGLNVTQGCDYIIRHGTTKLFKLGYDKAIEVLYQSFRDREDTVVRPI